MNKAKPEKEVIPDSLPFSFLKKDVDDEKIKAHWQKIKEKIEQQSPRSTGGEKNKNEL
ncbi:MAG TPA: hypothetical protein VIM16_08270 [Mucilaginibacter sp.]